MGLSICFLAMVLPAGNNILGYYVSSSHIAMAFWYLKEQVDPKAWASSKLKVGMSYFIENILKT